MGMKASADDNELVFRLRVAPHTATASDLKSFADEVLKTQKRINEGSQRANKTASLNNFGMPDEKDLAKAASAQLRHQQRMADANKKALDAEQLRVRKAADDKAKIDKKAADDAIREARREADAIEREQDRQHRRHRERQLSRARQNRADSDQAMREVVREERERERAAVRDMNREIRVNREIERRNEGIRRDREGSARTPSFAARAGAVNNLVGGASNLSRGVAYSGLVGERDSGKILDTLLKIEGGIALIHGGLSLGRGISALGAGGALAAAAPITAFVAAVAGAAFAINGIKRQITGEANHAGSYESKIGEATASLGGYGYRAGRAMGITKENTLGLSDDGVFSNARGLVESEDRLASQQKKSGMKNDPSAVRNRAISDIEFDSAKAQYDVHDQSQTERFKAEASTIRNPKSHSENNEELLDRLHTELAITSDLKRKAELKERISGLDLKGTSRVEATYGTESQRQQRSFNQSQGAADDQAIYNTKAEMGRTSDEGQREVLGQRLVELEKRRAEMIRDDLQLERDIARTKIDATRETIAGLKSQRDIQIQIYKDAEDKLKSAAEKFADLNVDEKSRLFGIKAKLDAAKNNPRQAEQIRSTISKEDRQLAKNSGLGDLEEGARQSALEKARREGFGVLAGGGAEERQAKAAAETAMKIETKLKVERSYVVSLERDDSNIVESLSKIIGQQLNVRDAAILQEAANRNDARLIEYARQANQRIIEGAKSMK